MRPPDRGRGGPGGEAASQTKSRRTTVNGQNTADGTNTGQPTNPHRLKLTDDHYRELSSGSGIADDIIAERGYETIWRDSRGIDRLKSLKIGRRHREPKTQRLPGLLIPMYRPTGEAISVQFKPLKPCADKNGRGQKYVSPYNRPAVVDMLPRHSQAAVDPTVELWITEGVKKADCLASHGVVAVALSGIYNWRSRHGTLGDWEDIQLKGRRKVVICFDSDAATNPDIAKAMSRLGHWLKNKGVKKVGYLVTPQGPAGSKTGVDDYLTWFGAPDELRDAITAAPPKPHDTGDSFTDARLAETIVTDVLDGRYRYNPGLGWLAWDGRRWASVADERLIEDVRQYALQRFAAAVKANNDGGRKGWNGVCAASRMRALIGLAAGIDGVFTEANELDTDPDLMNTPGGVVDLRDGEVIPHSPGLMMTKMTSGSYRPGAEHPDWKAALEAVPAETRGWFKARMGQAITGHAYPRAGLLRGGGENGKSLVVGTGIMRAIGDYATVASPGVLSRVKDGGPSPARMALRGARIVLIEEMTEGRSLDVTALKQIQDTEQITARYLYSDDVTFDVTHTLFITSNYLPVVNEVDHGVWRRLERIEFPYRFTTGELRTDTDREGDPDLKARLRSDDEGQHDAIVTWLVEGAIAAYSDDQALRQPASVERDTNAWRMQADRVLGFWAEHLVADGKAAIVKEELYEAFTRWLKIGGHQAWGKEMFHPRFAEHELSRRHGVEAKRPRDLEGLTLSDTPKLLAEPLPLGCSPPDRPKRPRLYAGVRFRTESDDEVEEPEGSDKRKDDVVQGGPTERESPAWPKEQSDFPFDLDHPGPPRSNGCRCDCHSGGGTHHGDPCHVCTAL